MPLKTTVGLCKKIGQPDYGSLAATYGSANGRELVIVKNTNRAIPLRTLASSILASTNITWEEN